MQFFRELIIVAIGLASALGLSLLWMLDLLVYQRVRTRRSTKPGNSKVINLGFGRSATTCGICSRVDLLQWSRCFISSPPKPWC